MCWEASDQPATGILAEEVAGIDDGREIIELGAMEIECLLVAEEVGVVEGGAVHELKALCHEKDGEDDQIDLAADSECLRKSDVQAGVALLTTNLLGRSIEVECLSILIISDIMVLERALVV